MLSAGGSRVAGRREPLCPGDRIAGLAGKSESYANSHIRKVKAIIRLVGNRIWITGKALNKVSKGSRKAR